MLGPRLEPWSRCPNGAMMCISRPASITLRKASLQPSILALSLFVHLMATVVWIGGLMTTLLLVWPAARRTLDQNPAIYRFLSRLRTRFFPLSTLSLTALIVTGLFQMTANPAYEGFMTFNNEWSRVMLAKHLTIVCMVICGLALQWGVIPSLERLSLL